MLILDVLRYSARYYAGFFLMRSSASCMATSYVMRCISNATIVNETLKSAKTCEIDASALSLARGCPLIYDYTLLFSISAINLLLRILFLSGFVSPLYLSSKLVFLILVTIEHFAVYNTSRRIFNLPFSISDMYKQLYLFIMSAFCVFSDCGIVTEIVACILTLFSIRLSVPNGVRCAEDRALERRREQIALRREVEAQINRRQVPARAGRVFVQSGIMVPDILLGCG